MLKYQFGLIILNWYTKKCRSSNAAQWMENGCSVFEHYNSDIASDKKPDVVLPLNL